jgi:hypothetical protein
MTCSAFPAHPRAYLSKTVGNLPVFSAASALLLGVRRYLFASVGCGVLWAAVLGSAHAQTITRIAGDGTQGAGAVGTPALSAALNQPAAVATDLDGRLLIMDSINSRLLRVDANGVIRLVTTTGFAAQQIAVDGVGNIYFADPFNHRVMRVDRGTGVTTPVTAETQGFTGDGGPVRTAQVNGPNGVAVDRSGNLFIADTGNHRVRRVDAVTGVITTVAGTGTAGFAGDGGAALAAQLNEPKHLAIDTLGRVVVADVRNKRVRRITVGGVIETLAGRASAANTSTGDGGPAVNATFTDDIRGIAVDGAGRVYLSDNAGQRVRRFTPGGVIETVAGNGAAVADSGLGVGDGGSAVAAAVVTPAGLWIDRTGNVLVALEAMHVVRRVAGIATPPLPPDSLYSIPAGAGLPSQAVGVELTGVARSLSVRATLEFATTAGAGGAAARAGPAGPWQVYLIALVPGPLLQVAQASVPFLQDSQGRWGPLANPVQAVANNVDATALAQNRLVVTILSSFDSSLLPGTEFYLGYGNNAGEMLSSGRYRGVYKVLPP